MKKCLALLLLTVVLFGCVCINSSAAKADIYFIAFNDTVPMTLSSVSEPLLNNNGTLVSHNAFSVSGLGITPAFDAEKKTVTLYSRSQRLEFNLTAGLVTDERGNTGKTTCAYRNNVSFLPVEFCANYFGFRYSKLTSAGGYTVIRFTNGQQIYDNSLFIEKAENLIDYRVQHYLAEQNQTTPVLPPVTPEPPKENDPPVTQDPPATTDPEKTPPTVYLAVEGVENMENALALLRTYRARATFFLTEEEIRASGGLVRKICAAGQSIGLTVDRDETDPARALQRANVALDETIQQKTLLVLLTTEQEMQVSGYFAINRGRSISAARAAASDSASLVVCSNNLAASLRTLDAEETVYRRLRETSPF